MDTESRFQQLIEHSLREKGDFAALEHRAVRIFEDAPCYDVQELVRLYRAQEACLHSAPQDKPAHMQAFARLLDAMTPRPDAPSPVALWPQGVLPQTTSYTANDDLRYHHDPDFRPYLFEMLLPETQTPKGALLCVAGGDHGSCSLTEAFEVCRDFNALGYQCFMLNNRVNHHPWNEYECGADVARAVRYVRANAARYRIRPDCVAAAGFSNGGLTIESCILHYSGTQSVAQHFPGYQPDALDELPGCPDAFLCLYGPHFKGVPYDFTGVVYPPTFFAVGREDGAMENLNETYPQLIAQGVQVEMHTFAATPHGVAGRKLVDGEVRYPLFELWMALADGFMQDVYRQRK